MAQLRPKYVHAGADPLFCRTDYVAIYKIRHGKAKLLLLYKETFDFAKYTHYNI